MTSVLLASFGGVFGVIIAFILIKCVSVVIRKQVTREFRQYLSLNSEIYCAGDWD